MVHWSGRVGSGHGAAQRVMTARSITGRVCEAVINRCSIWTSVTGWNMASTYVRSRHDCARMRRSSDVTNSFLSRSACIDLRIATGRRTHTQCRPFNGEVRYTTRTRPAPIRFKRPTDRRAMRNYARGITAVTSSWYCMRFAENWPTSSGHRPTSTAPYCKLQPPHSDQHCCDAIRSPVHLHACT
jgi:hypothetical protein